MHGKIVPVKIFYHVGGMEALLGWVSICTCVYMYVHVYVCVCAHVHVRANMYVDMYVCVHNCVHVYMLIEWYMQFTSMGFQKLGGNFVVCIY